MKQKIRSISGQGRRPVETNSNPAFFLNKINNQQKGKTMLNLQEHFNSEAINMLPKCKKHLYSISGQESWNFSFQLLHKINNSVPALNNMTKEELTGFDENSLSCLE